MKIFAMILGIVGSLIGGFVFLVFVLMAISITYNKGQYGWLSLFALVASLVAFVGAIRTVANPRFGAISMGIAVAVMAMFSFIFAIIDRKYISGGAVVLLVGIWITPVIPWALAGLLAFRRS